MEMKFIARLATAFKAPEKKVLKNFNSALNFEHISKNEHGDKLTACLSYFKHIRMNLDFGLLLFEAQPTKLERGA